MSDMAISQYKAILEKELSTLEAELKTVGRINPSNPNDWEPIPSDIDVLEADENESADKIESYEENAGILKQLETRFNEVKQALGRIEDGSYGTCQVCKNPIEEKRLDANPAATTCIAHMKE
jgi:RNA polymerase-binding transcription factor DksA